MKDLLNEISRMKDLLGYKKGQVISEQKVLLTEENLKCVVNPNLTPTGDDGTNKTYQKTIMNQDTSQVFGSDGGWVWVVPSGRIVGTWSCKPEGGFIINVTKGVMSMGSNIPEVSPNANDSFHFDSSKKVDSFNTAGWESGLYTVKQTTVTKNVTNTSTPTGQPTSNKTTAGQTLAEKVQSEDDKCNQGKKYVWKKVRHQYQIEKPEGKEGSMEKNLQLKKDWLAGWRPKCEGSSTPVVPVKPVSSSDDETPPKEDVTNLSNTDADDMNTSNDGTPPIITKDNVTALTSKDVDDMG